MGKRLLILLITLLWLFHQANSQQFDSLKDERDGKEYKTVKIGNQIWMAENLHAFFFRNGDPIPIVKTWEDWLISYRNKLPACRYLLNNSDNGKKYGVLYNFYAIVDPRGLAPKGYHIPSKDEWTEVINFLGGEKKAGLKMKSTDGWKTHRSYEDCRDCMNWTQEKKAGNTCSNCNDQRKAYIELSGNGNNESGFSGLPGHYVTNEVSFFDGYYGSWWSKTQVSNTHAIIFRLSYLNSSTAFSALTINSEGNSVRCVKD